MRRRCVLELGSPAWGSKFRAESLIYTTLENGVVTDGVQSL